MESKVPLPTDNIYKFYALFGLALFIFAIGAGLVLQKSTNENVYKFYVELESLKTPPAEAMASTDAPHPTFVRKALLERLIEVAKEDRKVISYGLSFLIALGGIAMAFGFSKWQREIQPIQDEMLKLQLEKLRLEVQAMSQPTPGVEPSSDLSSSAPHQSHAAGT